MSGSLGVRNRSIARGQDLPAAEEEHRRDPECGEGLDLRWPYGWFSSGGRRATEIAIMSDDVGRGVEQRVEGPSAVIAIAPEWYP